MRDNPIYLDIAHCVTDLPVTASPPALWIDGEEAVRGRWQNLVTARRTHLGLTPPFFPPRREGR